MLLWPIALALTLAAPPPPTEEIPGGYFEFGEVREPEPDRGDTKRLIGSIVFPLGVLRTGAGAAMLLSASPARCQGSFGQNTSAQTCKNLRTFGWVGIGYGGVMVATGATFLVWGLVLRSRHRAWKRRNNIAIAPQLGRDGGGFRIVWRF
ncbi:MAG TPA: hypothetical protein ENJ18_02735 [Nannocystis exedens]|nr:hypothetical protein [Nannocystis exedens]